MSVKHGLLLDRRIKATNAWKQTDPKIYDKRVKVYVQFRMLHHVELFAVSVHWKQESLYCNLLWCGSKPTLPQNG